MRKKKKKKTLQLQILFSETSFYLSLNKAEMKILQKVE